MAARARANTANYFRKRRAIGATSAPSCIRRLPRRLQLLRVPRRLPQQRPRCLPLGPGKSGN
eukprot:16430409-Heterocapsa_arctica.AAC.1